MENNLKVVVLGDGQLSRAIMQRRPAVNIIHLSRPYLDATYIDDTYAMLKKLRPDVVVNCTGYNDLEASELVKSEAMPVNVGTALSVQEAALKLKAVVIHFCTSLVYPGGNLDGFSEQDDVQPLSRYGKSKNLGSVAVLDHPNNYVFRTANIWSNFNTAHNLAANIYRGLLSPGTLTAEATQVTNFTAVSTLVEILEVTLARMGTRQLIPPGLYHVVDRGAATKFQFARKLATITGFDPGRIKPVTAEHALEPKHCTLNTRKLVEVFGDRLFRWDTNLSQFRMW